MTERALTLSVLAAITSVPPNIAHAQSDASTNSSHTQDIIIAQANSEGEIQFLDGSSYQGQMHNNMMHGSGLFTWSDAQGGAYTYQGEFRMNCMTGQGSLQYPDGSVYQGQFLDGLRHGHGIFRDIQRNVRYEGKWSQGQRHGHGTLFYQDHPEHPNPAVCYVGHWCKGLRHGQGTMRYASGNIYCGQWHEDRKNGRGRMDWFDCKQSYEGDWFNDLPHGFGEYTWLNIAGLSSEGNHSVPSSSSSSSVVDCKTHLQVHNRYVGQFQSGLRHGYGSFFYASGACYQGNWVENQKHGEGHFHFENGREYSGRFEHDRMIDLTDAERTSLLIEHQGKIEIKVDDILLSLHNAESDVNFDKDLVYDLLLKENLLLRKVYRSFCASDVVSEESICMTISQFFRFAREFQLISSDCPLTFLIQHAISRVMDQSSKIVLYQQFLELCVRIAFIRESGDFLSSRVSKLLSYISSNLHLVASHPATPPHLDQTDFRLKCASLFTLAQVHHDVNIRVKIFNLDAQTVKLGDILYFLQDASLWKEPIIDETLSLVDTMHCFSGASDNDEGSLQHHLDIDISFDDFVEGIKSIMKRKLPARTCIDTSSAADAMDSAAATSCDVVSTGDEQSVIVDSPSPTLSQLDEYLQVFSFRM